MPRLAVPLVAFVAFTGYTLFVATHHDLLGFFRDHLRGGWSLQVFLDLVVSATCFWVVAVPDARRRGLNPWPFVALTPFLGSIALLGYFVRRGLGRSGG